MTIPVWGQPKQRTEYNRVFCGNLVMHHFICPDLCFQAEDENGLQGICWAATTGTRSDSMGWLEKMLPGLDEEEKDRVLKDVEYLTHADKILDTMLTPNDIRLTLIVSRKRGCGSEMLDYLMNRLSGKVGYLFLWTDTTCDYGFYHRHGFEMVYQEKDTLFYDSEECENRIMIFRKKIG